MFVLSYAKAQEPRSLRATVPLTVGAVSSAAGRRARVGSVCMCVDAAGVLFKRSNRSVSL